MDMTVARLGRMSGIVVEVPHDCVWNQTHRQMYVLPKRHAPIASADPQKSIGLGVEIHGKGEVHYPTGDFACTVAGPLNPGYQARLTGALKKSINDVKPLTNGRRYPVANPAFGALEDAHLVRYSYPVRRSPRPGLAFRVQLLQSGQPKALRCKRTQTRQQPLLFAPRRLYAGKDGPNRRG